VITGPKGPTPNSEFEHSSIPATIKKIFNLSSNFLTHRDAWAGTFEQVVGELTSPRTDCPGIHHSPSIPGPLLHFESYFSFLSFKLLLEEILASVKCIYCRDPARCGTIEDHRSKGR
jgi:hypothetical protein